MSRPLRLQPPGVWHHLTARGNERRAIFRDDRDRAHFCQLLADLVERFRARLHAFVLMENHYHLLLELTEPNLSRAGQWLNVAYSVWFNRRHARSGHLFQGRFKSVVVDPSAWGLEVSRYVHLNPVRLERWALGKAQRGAARQGAGQKPEAEMVRQRLSYLRAYRWSSYRAYAGWEAPPPWLEQQAVWALGGGPKKNRRQAYRQYVEVAARQGLEQTPWDHLQEQVILGGKEFVRRIRRHLRGDAREQGAARRLTRERPSFEELVARLERVKNEPWAKFRDRHGDTGRDLALCAARRLCGLTLQELAALAGMNDYAAVALAVKRFESRLPFRPAERKQLEQLCQMLNVGM